MKAIRLFNTQQELEEYLENSTIYENQIYLFSEKEFGIVECDIKSPNYLWFEALEDGCQIGVYHNEYSSIIPNVEYSFDKINWTNVEIIDNSWNRIDVENGQKIYFRGLNENGFCNEDGLNNDAINQFSGNGKFNIGGDLTTLLNNRGRVKDLSEYGKGCFYSIFGITLADGVDLVNAENLMLTSNILGEKCYYYMFDGCESLTTAPVLPATTLADSCYSDMFSNCTSLTQAPVLPATTLANFCYAGMFQGCTSLTTAPVLPAIELTNGCYNGMFSGCTSLTTAPNLHATTLANFCYAGMFDGCESLTTAPVLPATTLADSCYSDMFSNCTNLLNITCLAEENIHPKNTNYWLSGVSSTGTFTKSPNATWPSGINGVPEGWTVIDKN